MRRPVTNSIAGILVLFFVWYAIVPLFLHSEGEAGELYDGHILGKNTPADRQRADDFFAKLETALKSEGFQRTGGPTTGGNGCVSAPEGQTWWYSGSYRGSHPFTVAVMRAGPELNCFHVSYTWYGIGFFDIRPKMRQSTNAMSAFLRDWSESQGALDFYARE